MSSDGPATLINSHKLESRWIILCLILAPVLVFSRTLGGGFLNWDDWEMVATNLDLRPEHWPAILTYWYHPHLRLFIPLTYSTYAFLEFLGTYFAGGVQPWWFHATNLLLHVSSGLMAWKLLSRITGDVSAGAVGAGVFLLHPVQVEAVAWISSLNTVLSGFLSILTLWFYVRSVDAVSPRQSRALFSVSCLSFILAMIAKPAVCALPLIAYVIDRAISKERRSRAIVRFVILCAVESPLVWIAHHLQAGSAAVVSTPLSHRPLVAADALGFYLLKLFAPFHLAIDYGRTPKRVSFGVPVLLGVAFILSVAAATAFHPTNRCLWRRAGMLIFAAGLLPVLGVVPFDFQFYSTVADRYLYLSMLGPAILVADLIQSWRAGSTRQKMSIASLAIFVVLILAAMSYTQTGVWTSDFRLFEQALRVNPTSIAANQTLGYIAAQAAEESAGNPRRQAQLLALALDHDRRALAENPDNPRVLFNRANLLLKIGRPSESLADYAAAASQFEDQSRLQNNWGVACLQLNDLNGALSHFHLAVEANPNFADALANAGTAYLRIGRPDLAREQFSRALTIDPSQVQAIGGMRQCSE